jgi:hypothetical protein
MGHMDSEAATGLRRCPLSAGLDDAALARAADGAVGRALDRGETLFREGDEADRILAAGGAVVRVEPVQTS